MAEIPFEPYTGQGKLRFWCQKVLPLVYDESLSYYELLNKVVDYLNNTISDVSACEDNITALRDAFVQLQDYVNEMFDDFEPEIERIIDEMIDSGEFGEILTDVVNGLIAGEYSTTQGYAQFDYVLKDGKLYCATASTSGEWDSTKWRETTVGADMQLLNQRVYNLNAGQVAFNESTTYDNNTVGKKLKDLDDFDDNLNAGQVEYNSENTYNNATVGKELQELKGSLNPITISSYADITAFLNANYDGFTRLCYVPATFMSTLSQGKNNAIGIGYVSRATATIADFFLRTGYDKIWTIRVSNGATTYVTPFFNSNLITNNYELSYNATRTYAIGDIVNIANDSLVRITRTISSGTAIVIGTNCESITIGSEIAYKRITPSAASNITLDFASVIKSKNSLKISIYASGTFTANESTKICDLPSIGLTQNRRGQCLCGQNVTQANTLAFFGLNAEQSALYVTPTANSGATVLNVTLPLLDNEM